ncbi:MAG: NAD(P)H-binding protein [Actinomycetota bacterium]
MRVAVTGGTGFVGGHLARMLAAAGHEVVVVARGCDDRPWAREVRSTPGVRVVAAGLGSRMLLSRAFEGCDAVAHCAGINRETGAQTYESVHVRGTATVVAAAREAGVRRLALVSFLRARPACGSPYHESKWAAEELVRASGLEWTVLKPGMMFGRGDHMLDHLSRVLGQLPVFVGIGPRVVRPLAVEDAVRVLAAALGGRLPRQTDALVGPTAIGFDDAARLVARLTGSRARFVRAPLGFHRLLARAAEAAMTTPLVSTAQVRMLGEGMTEPVLAPDPLPADLTPRIPFDEDAVRAGLPPDGFGFHRSDLRLATGRIRLTADVDAPPERCFDAARDIGLHERAGAGERAVGGRTTGLIRGGSG